MKDIIKRRHLPHLYFNEGRYFITYRLAGTIPGLKNLRGLKYQKDWSFEEFKEAFEKYDHLLHKNIQRNNDLKDDVLAGICIDSIMYPNEKDYNLICYCVMPNHVHIVFELLQGNRGISKIMQGVKRASSRKCNKSLDKEGKFWQDESYDRFIRDDREYYYTIRYVLKNPVKAGLVKDWQSWPYTYCAPGYEFL